MNCQEVEPFVSMLYDGENVPAECADHIDACPDCRAKLRSYSEMGAELRLIASRMPAESGIPQGVEERMRSSERGDRFAFLRARIVVPKFAAIAAAAAVVALSASVVVVRAQSQNVPLWFQFDLAPGDAQVSDGQHKLNTVARAGYDDQLILMTPVLDANHHVIVNQKHDAVEMRAFGTHLTVSSIKDGKVQLAIRSRLYRMGDSTMFKVKDQLGDLEHHSFTYTPGQSLEVPVEGGGTLILRGQIADHQPKFAWGQPVEPRSDEIVLTHPVLFKGKTVLAFQDGGSASADSPDSAVSFTGEAVRVTVALRSFPGAVQAQANWGKLAFKVNGESYTLFSASPICGGEQPHAVWVELDAKYSPSHDRPAGIGTARLPKAAL
jgi:hypothetical protein